MGKRLMIGARAAAGLMVALAIVALIVTAYVMVLTRAGHLHWVLP